MRLSLIPLFFLLLPMAEIATFIVVGREIGVAATLGLILLSAVVGAVLLRAQGLGVLRKLQSLSRTGENPGRQIVHGAMIVIAAFLLILPGFLSDLIGILLFIPAVREAAWQFLRKRVTVVTQTSGTRSDPANARPRSIPGVIDLDDAEFTRDPDHNGPSDRLR
ncbi:exclusion suppressor FxsA [Rhizobium sp. Leaf384]|uniref:FxsA family protein n=1 Tax=unclassified Rhizobium TaxID=2613769 RepID=UPI0007129877|nr:MULTISPECIES: FxsA family protein [unclassified Rhizobium]KQS76100.1 exclusion suppressor FxsA [Rhizobium sp. Leaf384]KQS85845.1 exclusion suppressor FxsA [Rhizobium sp. Leaf383]